MDDATTTGRSDLREGRAAFAAGNWAVAYARLTTADSARPLEAGDLARLAQSAQLLARDDDGLVVWERAYREAEERNDLGWVARAALWLTLLLMDRGDAGRATGYLNRAARVLEAADPEGIERAQLLVPMALRQAGEGNLDRAEAGFRRALEIAHRFHDQDLGTLARLGHGQLLIRSNRVSDGVAALDEAMVAVTAGEVSPMAIGIVYCGVIESCQLVFELGRAREWTAMLGDWCSANQDLVPFRGECLTYRSELLRGQGKWVEAINEARRARDLLERSGSDRALGAACYELAESQRLRGELGAAEATFRLAHEHGRDPQPGMALVRLAQGRVIDAVASIGSALDGTPDPLDRCRLLPAAVEILLAAGDIDGAGRAQHELAEIAGHLTLPPISAAAAQAAGAVHLARGEPRAALRELRAAISTWQLLELPYAIAQTRVQLATACRRLGDLDTAGLELRVARRVFEALGAITDLARMAALDREPRSPNALTPRELEVLRLLATGRSNHEIGAALDISDRTVARHVSNILAKLELPSRAAATAYAFRHGLQ